MRIVAGSQPKVVTRFFENDTYSSIIEVVPAENSVYLILDNEDFD